MNFFEISQRLDSGKQTYEYFVKRKKVCQKAWLKSHGISNGRYSYIAVEPFVCNKAGPESYSSHSNRFVHKLLDACS